MIPYLGDFPEDHTHVQIPFNTFSSDDPSASVTITDLVDADIKVHKDGHVDQIVTDGATVVINFDGITGNHLITIDTSVDAAYTTGSEYQVRIEGTTVDGATINAWIGSFSIERAGGVIALLKLIQAAVITNAAGADVAADIIAVKAETAVIVNDTDVIDDGTSGLVKIAQDVAAILVDTGVIGALGAGLTAITDDTGNIPASPAPASEYDTEMARITANVATEAKQDTIDTVVDGIQTDLSNATDGLGALKTLIEACSTHDAAAVKTAIEAAGSHLALIKAVTDALTSASATKLALSAGTIVVGAAAVGTLSTTQMTTNLTEVTDDHYNGRIVIWTSGVLQNQATDITDYDGATKKLIYTATTEAPSDGDTFVLV